MHEKMQLLATTIKTMAIYDRIKEYALKMRIYLDTVEAYFAANKIADDQKAMVLLGLIGSPTFTQLSDLMAPESPLKKTIKR